MSTAAKIGLRERPEFQERVLECKTGYFFPAHSKRVRIHLERPVKPNPNDLLTVSDGKTIGPPRLQQPFG
jgi:hypothetical protein